MEKLKDFRIDQSDNSPKFLGLEATMASSSPSQGWKDDENSYLDLEHQSNAQHRHMPVATL